MEGRRRGQTRARVRVVEAGRVRTRADVLATEEPLEIRLRTDSASRPLTVTMRTPGNDFELAAGFLFAEGIIAGGDDVRELSYCVDREVCGAQEYNVVTVELRPHVRYDPTLLERSFSVTSACGICGKSSLDQIERRGIGTLPAGPVVPHDVLYGLPDALRRAQGLFAMTGGLHAAGLFTASGELVALREDVGRHNAVDKLVGWALLEGKLPLREQIVLVSGRSSFEIGQKCVAAGVPILCAVSAPSSLAVDLARRFDLTLIGFLRGDRFNIYHGAERIGLADDSSHR
jgi:FdhD protein